MIYGVTCSCGGAVPMVRKVFKKAGIENWLDIPVYEGKRGLREFCESLTEVQKSMYGYEVLMTHLENKGSYAIVVGISNDEFRWADIKGGGIKDKLDAEIIAQDFAIC